MADYSKANLDMAVLGTAVNLAEGGGDAGRMFPQSDVEDFAQGARYIPGEVTMARRQGQTVSFDPQRHQWTMPNGRVVPDRNDQ